VTTDAGRDNQASTAVAAGDGDSAEPILRLRGVGRRFGGLHAVRDVDLDVVPGERRAILGPNGAGKTTLFNVISGDLPPTSGTIELFGGDVTLLAARQRAKLGLARTYQKSRLFLGLTVEDNLYLAALGVEHGHFRPVVLPGRDGDLRTRARETAARVGLGGKLNAVVGELSHGEQRQLEVGMARVAGPRLMLLDEPASGLSRGERVALTDLLLRLDPEITLILIEHDMDVALRVAQRVTMMHDGRVIVEGTPAEIRANETVHDLYLGSSYAEDVA
jgi:branched-chain amino acid transport system ATP-binding protein